MSDIEQPSEPTRLERIKQHLQENKKVYLVGAGCLGAGYFLRPQVVNIVDVCNLKYKSPTNNIIINALGDPGNVVQCVETGTVYASQNQAARELGVAAARISEHLHGKIPHVQGHTFVLIAKAEVPPLA